MLAVADMYVISETINALESKYRTTIKQPIFQATDIFISAINHIIKRNVHSIVQNKQRPN